ncbi:MarR family EPS-associated transcriptional regulator [Acidithiobacillus caldus]|uniref:MarR family EPS-associated transcriptional regulator n=1 Tax=Acidithiobacillus caldus TaxID=33059 RepID=UPI0009837BA0|nr:MarR family EPS-associated transcriptional regulator [Acidithiobacillus caldus]
MIDDTTRYQLLKLLAERPKSSQRELAVAMGMSLGKTNYCVRALVEKGFVKIGRFRKNPNKSDYAYLLTPAGIQEKARVTLRFLQRKMAEYEALRVEIASLRQEVADVCETRLDVDGESA